MMKNSFTKINDTFIYTKPESSFRAKNESIDIDFLTIYGYFFYQLNESNKSPIEPLENLIFTEKNTGLYEKINTLDISATYTGNTVYHHDNIFKVTFVTTLCCFNRNADINDIKTYITRLIKSRLIRDGLSYIDVHIMTHIKEDEKLILRVNGEDNIL